MLLLLFRLMWKIESERERQKKAFKIHFQAQLMRHRVAIILLNQDYLWWYVSYVTKYVCISQMPEDKNLQVNKFCGHFRLLLLP